MKGKSLFKVAGIIAIVTIISKIIGFWRDLVIAQAFGASMVSDAYFYAYQIPSLALILLGGLGGPFHTATVAIFSKRIPDLSVTPDDDTQKLFNTFLTITSIGFLILSIIAFFYSDLIIRLITWGAAPEMQNLASAQLKIMSPIMLIGGVVGIFYGIANVYNKFTMSALSPTVLSIATIAAVLTAGDKYGAIVLAWSTLIGAIGQLLVQLPASFKAGFKIKPAFDLQNESLKKIGEVLFPAMLGTTIGQINIYVDMFFASQLSEGSWSAIGYANRLFQLPVGIMITAFLVPLFPMFSSFVGKKDWESLKNYFNKGLMSLWFIAFPIFALIVLFAYDGVKLLFERGMFDANDTYMVTAALIYLSISIIPYVARDTLTRIFYAFDDSKIPFLVACFSIFVKALMNILFVKPLGIAGITLSTTVVTLVNAILLSIFIKKKIRLGFSKLINPTLKIIAATAITGIIIALLNYGLNHIFEITKLFLFIKLSTLSLLYFILYFIICTILKVQSAKDFYEKIKKSIKNN